MSCFWILVLFFGLQNNQRCGYRRENKYQCGCDERHNDRCDERCDERRSERRNDNDCGCNDTFIQTRNYTNFQSQSTCGCEES